MDVYNNLANYLNNKIKDKQFWLGITGGPGAGKSTISNNLANIMNTKYKVKTLVIPMDGFHYPKEYLLSKRDHDFLFFKKRGSPMSFDVNSFCSQLIKAKKFNKTIYFPSFCRIIDDPIVNDIEFNSSYQLIIVEGNYLNIGNISNSEVNKDEYIECKKWNKLNNFFDETWFIEVKDGIECQKNRLINRHLNTWKEEKNFLWKVKNNLEGAIKQTEFNDIPNLLLVNKSKKYCDKIILN